MKKNNLTLVLDCATFPTVFLLKNGELIIEKISETERSCDNYMELINEALKDKKISIEQINEIVINKGPGSFTGLRVAVSIAKAFGFESNVVFKTFTSFDYLKARKNEAILLNGFSNFVYIKYPTSKMDCVDISSLDKKISYVVNSKTLFDKLTLQGYQVSLNNNLSIGEIYPKLKLANANELEPLYLRKSQAELQREEKNKKV